MKNVLFVCSQNKWRSPTAEQVFGDFPGLEVHRTKLQTRFRRALKGKRVVCLNIPDKYQFMDPDLVALLQSRVHL